MPFKRKTGVSALEYTLLISVILFTILSFQKYLVRGFAGRWKVAGDTFGFGKQYDPQKTIECTYSEDYNKWYDKACYDEKWNDPNTGYANCVRACAGDCTYGSGSNHQGCDCFIPAWPGCWIYSPECCYRKCEDNCSQSISQSSVDDCEGSVINCNDCCYAGGGSCPPNVNCGGP